jgi:uncharacterized protein DUF6165
MKIEISNGELVDKVSILSIKLKKIKATEKLANIRKEFDILCERMHALGIAETSAEFQELVQINLNLWEIEDKIRLKESAREFDDEFIQLARSVYFENDKRSHIKRQINIATRSELMEEKEYTKY